MHYYYNLPPSKNLLQAEILPIISDKIFNITPPLKRQQPFFGKSIPTTERGRKLCKTLLLSTCNILSSKKHDRILNEKKSNFQVQIHSDIHVS